MTRARLKIFAQKAEALLRMRQLLERRKLIAVARARADEDTALTAVSRARGRLDGLRDELSGALDGVLHAGKNIAEPNARYTAFRLASRALHDAVEEQRNAAAGATRQAREASNEVAARQIEHARAARRCDGMEELLARNQRALARRNDLHAEAETIACRRSRRHGIAG